VTPQDMLDTVIRPQMAGWGITRLADVTGLDYLGIPLAAAVRPLGEPTRLVGAGPTFTDAATSAALAVAKLWHASSSVPSPVARGTASDLQAGYELDDLGLPPDCLVTRSTVLDWVQARSLTDGTVTAVPRDLVCLGRPARRQWRPGFLTAATTGLGTGPTRGQAILNGLCDWATHDAIARLGHGAIAGILDARTIPDAWCAAAVQQATDADGHPMIAALPSRTGMPCWAAAFRGGDVVSAGVAARPDSLAALTAAICDAAASRLAALAGSASHRITGRLELDGWHGRPLPWPELAHHRGQRTSGGTSVATVIRMAHAATGAAPLVVDLAGDEGLAVVKVLCPDPARRARP
jgi:ribosomal protein S12 methylthiotransferase accessory factor